MEIKQPIDYLFIGLGASNCLLILELEKKGLLDQKKIVIIEPHQKNKKDKTYCFWATHDEASQIIDSCFIDQSWSHVILNGKVQNLSPLSYYHVSSLTLYQNTLRIISEHQGIVLQNTVSIHESLESVCIEHIEYKPKYIFDCRPPKTEPLQKHEYFINQSFIGWQIETEFDTFDTNSFTMMDFSVPQDNATQFVYVLPFSSTSALVEVTRFGKEIMQRSEGDHLLKKYLQKMGSYHITDVEIGCIPMTNAKLPFENNPMVRNMGSRAGHVKPSTGYAFRSMAIDAQKIADQIKSGIDTITPSDYQRRKNRFAFYDRLLLHILSRTPHIGKPIFERLFDSIKATNILKFLDERTSIQDEIKIFYSLQWKPFLNAAFYDIMSIDRIKKSVLIPFFITLLFLIFNGLGIGYLSNTTLFLGLLILGIPHGAVDHILENNQFNEKIRLSFIVSYLGQSSIIIIVWLISPVVALLFFLAYSIYHFAQADFTEWKITSKYTWLWGTLFFLGILLGHPQELSEILNDLSISSFTQKSGIISESLWIEIAYIALGTCLTLGVVHQIWGMCVVSFSLLLAIQLPLLQAFGIYFIFQHSLLGWNHIRQHFKVTSLELWKKAAIYSVGAYGLFLGMWFVIGDNWGSYIGTFFIFLSAISFPHIIKMDTFYAYFRQKKRPSD